MKTGAVSGQRVDLAVLDTLRLANDDFPITLKKACEDIFGGAISPSSLKREHQRGNLAMAKVGGKFFVTRKGIEDMLAKCQLAPPERDRGFGSSQSARMVMEASRPHVGSSATAASSVALDSLKATVAELKKP